MAEGVDMQTRVTVKIDSELLKRLRERARQRGISVSALVEECLRGYLEETCR